MSRVREGKEAPLAVYRDRVFALGGASNGGYGAMRSLMALRQVLEQGCGALVIPDQIAVARAGDAFDDMDNLKDEGNARRLQGRGAKPHRNGETLRMTAASPNVAPRERVIVALDLPSVAVAEKLVGQLGDSIVFYKIGYQLGYAGGLAFAQDLIKAGKKVFLDLKLHDIGNTVDKGVESIVNFGATFLTVHAYPQTMKAALDARARLAAEDPRGHDPHLLQRRRRDRGRLCRQRARPGEAQRASRPARSASTASSARRRNPRCCGRSSGPTRLLVTPGIRPAGADDRRPEAHHDAGGRDSRGLRLSRGRPADHRRCDPKAAADAIVAEIDAARQGRKGENDGEGLLDRDASMCTTTRATSPTPRPILRSSRNMAAASWCAAASSNARRAKRRSRNVVIEFPDYAAALACYNSPEYQANIKVRQPHSIADILIIEGYDGPQP